MKKRNLNQVQLGTALAAHGISGQGTISKWLSGSRTPNRRGAAALHAVLGIPVESWPLEKTPAVKSKPTARKAAS